MNTAFFRSEKQRYRLVSAGRGGGRRAKHSDRAKAAFFRPGEPVPETGIYEVLHDRKHRISHEVMLRSKDLFPPCDQCGMHVRFKVIRTAPYIFEDEDFIEEL